MKIKLIAMAILAFLMIGCSKRVIVHVPVTPGMTAEQIKDAEGQAIARQQLEERRRKVENSQENWKQRLGLNCPDGGYENVVIHPRLGNEARWLPSTGFRIVRRQVYVLRAINTEDGLIDIHDTLGLVVHNMCAKGSITLIRSLPGTELGMIQTRNSYYQNEQVFWLAGGITSQKSLGLVRSPVGSLYTNSWQRRTDDVWEISLRPSNGQFYRK